MSALHKLFPPRGAIRRSERGPTPTATNGGESTRARPRSGVQADLQSRMIKAGPTAVLAASGPARRAGDIRMPASRPALLWISLLALLLVAAPYAAGFVFAPHGLVFLGALNNLGDAGQYLAALRQGAEGHLLYTNQYSSVRSGPVLIYPLYTIGGLLLGGLHLPAPAMYYLVQAAAAVALLAALYRFSSVVLPNNILLCYGLIVFGGGLYLPVLLLSGLLVLPFQAVALTAPEYSTFATLLLSPHGTAGLAGEVWAVTGYLLYQIEGRRRHLASLAAGGLLLGLSYPFGLPVLLAVMAVDLAIRHGWLVAQTGGRRGRVQPNLRLLVPPALALIPAFAVAAYYGLLFLLDPLWSGSNLLRLPPPGLAVLAAAFGPLLILAARAVPTLRTRLQVDGTGRLMLVWAVVNGLLLLAPLPQSERLCAGWSIPLAVLAAIHLARLPLRSARRWVLGLSMSNVTMALLYLAVAVSGTNSGYYASRDQMAAVDWLAAHSGPGDVVMASAGSGNLIVSAARCHVVVGQNFQTFHWAQAQADVWRFFNATTPRAERAAVLRRQRVSYVLAGPYERAIGAFDPATDPAYRLAFASGAVRVFSVESG